MPLQRRSHQLKAYNDVQCWKVGGFIPDVLIFLGPNGSLLTAGMLSPEPMPLNLAEVIGPVKKQIMPVLKHYTLMLPYDSKSW